MDKSTSKSAGIPGHIEGTAGLAAYLGVSRWTVSRVLNGQPGVKEETRERVLEAIDELGFEPNRMARGLKGARSGLIGVSFQDLETLILAEKSNALQKLLREAGYRGLFEMPGTDLKLQEEVIRHFLSIQVDGIVLIGSTLGPGSSVWDLASVRDCPLVAVDPREALGIPTVNLDRSRAMEEIYYTLYEAGHRRIGLLGLGSDDMYQNPRRAGLEQAISVLGATEGLLEYNLSGYSHQDYGYGAALAEACLSSDIELPTGLICLSDRIAIGALRTFQERGLRVPEDVSIIGFDNLPEGNWTRPRLTTYDQNIDGLMGSAMEALMARMEGEDVSPKMCSGRLVIRESTARPRTGSLGSAAN